MNPHRNDHRHPARLLSRRTFLAGVGATALSTHLSQPGPARAAQDSRKINLGLIGCGGRGIWIGELFRKHGGYNLVAAADYFPERVQDAQTRLGVPADRCFTGLNGYRRLLEQDLEAVVIETPPYFHPEQAAAAVEAGRHVFLAKPVGVDVPGVLSLAETGRRATAGNLCLLVDFQTRAAPAFQEAARRVQAGELGPLIYAEAGYQCGPTWPQFDGALRKDPGNPEVRLRAWGLSRALSGDVITEQNIHSLDLATWFLAAEPLKACGTGGRRDDGAGDIWDHFGVLFHFPGGVFLSFSSKQTGFGYDDIFARVYGLRGVADAHYFGEVTVKSKEDIYEGGRQANLYTDGAVNNIATFHRAIVTRDFSNPTVAPSVRSNLVSILGRMAAYRHGEVTWEDMLRARESFAFETKGLRL